MMKSPHFVGIILSVVVLSLTTRLSTGVRFTRSSASKSNENRRSLKNKAGKKSAKGKKGTALALLDIITSYDISSGIVDDPVLSYGIPYGKVYVHQVDMEIWIEMYAYNLAVNCAPQGAYKCGVHIHTDTDCSNPSSMHHWNPDVFKDDPWKNNYYTSDEFGQSDYMNSGFIYMSGNGYSFQDNVNHALVIHSYNGTKIACGVLKAVE